MTRATPTDREYAWRDRQRSGEFSNRRQRRRWQREGEQRAARTRKLVQQRTEERKRAVEAARERYLAEVEWTLARCNTLAEMRVLLDVLEMKHRSGMYG